MVIDRIVGDVHDRDVIVLDDEIATAGSIVELLRRLRADGVGQIALACTHGLFTGPAIERLKQEPGIAEIVATNTVPLPDGQAAAQHGEPVGGAAVRRGGASGSTSASRLQPVQRRARRTASYRVRDYVLRRGRRG